MTVMQTYLDGRSRPNADIETIFPSPEEQAIFLGLLHELRHKNKQRIEVSRESVLGGLQRVGSEKQLLKSPLNRKQKYFMSDIRSSQASYASECSDTEQQSSNSKSPIRFKHF